MATRWFWRNLPLLSISVLMTSCGLLNARENVLSDETIEVSKLKARSDNLVSKSVATSCDGKPAGSTEQRLRFEKESVFFGESCRPETQMRICNAGKWSDWSGGFSSENCVVQKSLDCVGGTNGSQETRTRFKSTSVTFGSTCQQELQTRSCNAGVWTPWSGSFREGVCFVGEPKDCDSGKHGASESRIRYKSSSVAFGGVCQGELQVRFCDNGSSTSWNGSFENENCEVRAPASCISPSMSHAGIATRIRFKENSPVYGSACESELQVASCFDGKSSGFSGSFEFDSCKVQLPKSCEYRAASGTLLKILQHGESVSKIVYEKPEVEFGSECSFENLVAVCTNGRLDFAASKFSSPNATCVVKKASPCLDQKGTSVASGTTESKTMYVASTAKFGESCQPELRTRTCNNGAWSSWTGKADFESCVVEKPLSCGKVAHGGTESQVRYEKSAVAFGTLCAAEVQQRSCSNGVFSNWSGSYSEVNCSVLPALSCQNTPHDGVETRVRYGAESVPYGSSCSSEIQARSCFNGQFGSWSGALTFASCNVQAASPCEGGIASGTTQSRKQFLQKEAAFGQTCQEEIQTRTCNNGRFSDWSGSFAEPACAVAPPLSCGAVPHAGFETRTRYVAGLGNTAGQCISEVQSRSCSNGALSPWSGSYQFEKCETLVPQQAAFAYTGAIETFKVPKGVYSLEIKAWGGGGCVFDETPNYAASHNADFGGAGGFSSAVISVQPDEILSIQVAQGGQKTSSSAGGYPNGGAGYNGGCDGGGSSNVFIGGTSAQNLILVAGGGGGAGWYTPGGAQPQGNGAPGGGLIAQSGKANPGAGGTQSEGGQTGNVKGTLLKGAAASGNGGSGGPGAGGGGYYGGASGVGGNGGTNGGGGGGSCFVGFATGGAVLVPNSGSNSSQDYIDSAGGYRLSSGRTYSMAECLSGSEKNPPKLNDVDYVAGVGRGGEKANAVQIPGYSANWKAAVGGNGRVVIRYGLPASLVATANSSPTPAASSVCAADEANVPGLGCLYKEGSRYLIGVIKQNVINPSQVTGAVRPDDTSKVIDDARWQKIWNAADATSAGNWRLAAQMETSANAWENVSEPAANNIHLMKNANRLPLLKTLAAPVLTAYVYSLFHHETSGDTWTGMDYSGIIYGGPNGYSTFGWYNQAGNPSFFSTAYSYSSNRMRLWLYPSSVDLVGTVTAPPPRKSAYSFSGSVQTWKAQRAATPTNPIVIKVWGAGGATVKDGAAGGGGGYSEISVTSGINAGDALSVYVAGAGQPGAASRSAGGGGGASAVLKGDVLFAVGAGGGGSHAVAGSGYGGAGGGNVGVQGGGDGCGGGLGGGGASGSTQGVGGPSNRNYAAGQPGRDGRGGDGGSGNGGSTQTGTGGWGWRNGGDGGAVPGDGGGGGGGAGYSGGGGGGGGCWGMGGGGGSSHFNSSFGTGTLTPGSGASAGQASDADNAGQGAASQHGRVVIID